jgi:hypothetical protein
VRFAGGEAAATWRLQKRAKRARPSYRPAAPGRSGVASWMMHPSTFSAWRPHRPPNWLAQSLYRGCLPCCRTPPAPCYRSLNLSRARKSEWARPPSYNRAGLKSRRATCVTSAISWSRSPVQVRPRNLLGRLSASFAAQKRHQAGHRSSQPRTKRATLAQHRPPLGKSLGCQGLLPTQAHHQNGRYPILMVTIPIPPFTAATRQRPARQHQPHRSNWK